MVYIYEPRFEITAEIRDKVKAELEERFPHVQFRAYSRDSEHHTISVNNFDFSFSLEYTRFLGELEKKYAPDYDVFDICFNFMKFGSSDKHLNERKNKVAST